MLKHVAAVTAMFLVATLGWVVLGTTVMVRTEGSDRELRSKVGRLWGEPLTQSAPSADLQVPTRVEREEWDSERTTRRLVTETVVTSLPVPLAASEVEVNLDLDQRRKGLLWYATLFAVMQLTGRIDWERVGRGTGGNRGTSDTLVNGRGERDL